MAKNVTLFDPPQLDSSKAPIENVLELTPVVDIGPVSAHHSIPPEDQPMLTQRSVS